MAPKKRKAVQPTGVTTSQVVEAFKLHTPDVARADACKTGYLFRYTAPKTAYGADKDQMQIWHEWMEALLKINNTGVFNVSTFQSALKEFNPKLNYSLTDPAHKPVAEETEIGNHMLTQSKIAKAHFAALIRIKRNTTSSSRHPAWLRSLLNLLVAPDGMELVDYDCDEDAPETGTPKKEASLQFETVDVFYKQNVLFV